MTVPEGEWFCPECENESVAVLKKGKRKAKAQPTEEGGAESKAAGKRKAPSKAKGGGELDISCQGSIY
jgi:hypothetical protein